MARRAPWLLAAGAACLLCTLAASALLFGLNPAVRARPQRSAWWQSRHQAKVAEARQRAGQVDLLFVGDSITQNYERTATSAPFDFLPIWSDLFAPHRAMNLGFNSDRTENVLWRLRHGEVDGLTPADIVLLIGTNNFTPRFLKPNGDTPAQVSDGILAVVAELHRRMPAARILVLSVLPTGISAERSARSVATNLRLQAALAGVDYVRWLDVSGLFLHDGRLRQDLFYDPLLGPDVPALHPTAAGQRLMAEAVAHALYGR